MEVHEYADEGGSECVELHADILGNLENAIDYHLRRDDANDADDACCAAVCISEQARSHYTSGGKMVVAAASDVGEP